MYLDGPTETMTCEEEGQGSSVVVLCTRTETRLIIIQKENAITPLLLRINVEYGWLIVFAVKSK